MFKMKNNKPWEVPNEDVKSQTSKGGSAIENDQYWADEDVEIAIKEANVRGIDPQKLFGTSQAKSCS